MLSSWIHLLSPNSLELLEYAAWATLLIALVLWALGVGIARAGVALATGLLGAAIAALLSQYCNHDTFLAAIGLGFAAGAALGALSFKTIQAFTLALLLASATAGLYYHWHADAIPSPTALTTLHAKIQASLPAPPHIPTNINDLGKAIRQIQPQPLPQPQPALSIPALAHRIQDQFLGASGHHLRRMLLAALAAAVAALIIAYTLPRLTTGIVTSVAGAALLLAAARILVQIHIPHQAALFPNHPWSWHCALMILAGAGFLFQYRIFLRPPDKAQKTKTPQKAHA